MSPADFDMDDDPREQISELEEQIEELAGALERCRKTALASKAAMVLGAILLAAIILGVIAFDPMAMVAALAALLGGVVVFGSNNSTSHQLSQSMKNAEALRAALIGRLDIRPGRRRKPAPWQISLKRRARVRAHGGLSASTAENQATLSQAGWLNEISSVQVQSGTWEFYADENFGGASMGLTPGTYPTSPPGAAGLRRSGSLARVRRA
jgi:hypothetical protein